MAETTAVAVRPEDREIAYVPLGAKSEIRLSMAMVKAHIARPTKRGNKPADSDIVRFMMLCKYNELDPWANDAYLVGYDSNDGPQFNLIVSIAALFKRAEASHQYDGIESGVVVAGPDGRIIERQGDLVLDGERLVGGWARVHRKDRSVPSYDSLKLSTFNSGVSRWKADPAGMIVKCAEASALRKAFPSRVGTLYTSDEMSHVIDIDPARHGQEQRERAIATSLNSLAERLEQSQTQHNDDVRDEQIDQDQPAEDQPVVDNGPYLRKLIGDFNAAAGKGAAAVTALYDSLLGPDGDCPSELSEQVTEMRDKALAKAAAPKKQGGLL